MNYRDIALENLISVLEDGKKLHLAFKDSLEKIPDIRERSFVLRLTKGCVEKKLTLDYLIGRLSKVGLKKLKPVIRNILRLGLYQIFFMDSVTDFAACDESVKMAARRGLSGLKGFVNGILRNACRKKNELTEELEEAGKKDMGLLYSVPEWIVKEYRTVFGQDGALKAFEYFLKDSPLSLRLNVSRCSLRQFEEELAGLKDDIKLEKNDYIGYCFRIKRLTEIEKNELFKRGLFVIQDFSSVLVGFIADSVYKERIGEESDGVKKVDRARVLDLCAAPGGKSLHMADLGYKVISCDISKKKLELISEAAHNRCGFTEDDITILENDAVVFNPAFENAFDIVLADLPCSGLGVIGRKPDLKYVMTEQKSRQLSILQKEIIKNAVRYLKEGGILIYSTCTVTECENGENAAYIGEYPGLTVIPVSRYLPKGMNEENGDFLRILPGKYLSDGFFISCFVKDYKNTGEA